MREIIASVDSAGRVTLPAEIRRRLGVGTPGKIAFVLEPDGAVTLQRPKWTWATVKGSVPALLGESADLEAEIADAIEAAISERERWQPPDEA
jgi:bifunctional DNA-binding transcriptional regulator/antitoxin component of YhaV-PrlF toxin-antitoxin module